MNRSIDVFNAIASDIGIKRIIGEEESSFCQRTTYSAARYWVLAFCMDDGADGKRGLAKQALNRRLKRWVASLDGIRPGLLEWFDAGGKGISTVYNRLIDMGDLAPIDFSKLFAATRPSRIDLSATLSCITGFLDPTLRECNSCGFGARSVITSGLLSIVETNNEFVFRPEPWWVTDFDYMEWEKSSHFEEVKFADVNSLAWNVGRADVWVDEPDWMHSLALARVDGGASGVIYFIASQMRNGVRLSRISWIQAQELFFYLRREAGNEIIVRYSMLDCYHAKASLPIGFLPGYANRVLDAIGWPVENAVDRFNRIFRVEAIPAVGELLSDSCARLEETSCGR